jgi:hypothetical protein
MTRHLTSLPEESYHSWNYVPVRNRQGEIEGIVNINIGAYRAASHSELILTLQRVEVTEKVITARRMNLLRELSTRAGQ